MAKSLVFLAHMRGAASDFVEYFSTKEIMACGKSYNRSKSELIVMYGFSFRK